MAKWQSIYLSVEFTFQICWAHLLTPVSIRLYLTPRLLLVRDIHMAQPVLPNCSRYVRFPTTTKFDFKHTINGIYIVALIPEGGCPRPSPSS